MPALADLQTSVVSALLNEPLAVSGLFAAGPAGVLAGLEAHRRTIFGALTAVLRTSFPTVEALVGAAYFDQIATSFVRRHPPMSPDLFSFAAPFADFLDLEPTAVTLPYLADAARLDRGLEQACRVSLDAAGRQADLGGELWLTLAPGLTVLTVDWPVAQIRTALGDDEALAAIDMTARPQGLALWRSTEGAMARSLSPMAARLLVILLGGAAITEALDRASQGSTLEHALASLETEIIPAPFARLTTA